MIAEKREKISLDIPPVVVFEGEEWNVGTIDHHENTVNIFRNTSIERKEYTYYDIETKTVNASELYKADTKCMPLKKLDDFSKDIVYTKDLLNYLGMNGIDMSKIKIEDCKEGNSNARDKHV